MPNHDEVEEEVPQKKEKILMEVTDPTAYIKTLRDRMQSLVIAPKFSAGDIIVWKEGMRNKTLPELDTPGIVLNIFFPPLEDDEANSSSSYYNDILDIQVGFITSDDEFIVFAQDSRRFKLYQP